MDITSYIPKFFDELYKEEVKNLTSIEEVRDAFHSNQITSKNEALFALSRLPIKSGEMLYIGSWFGFLSYAICDIYPNYTVDEVDIDPRCKTISTSLNKNHKNFRESFTSDVFLLPNVNNYKTVVNLSSEHMASEWFDRFEMGTQFVIQCNNLDIDDHVNLCYNIKEFQTRYSLSEIFYLSELKLNIYSRYTIAGIK